MTPSSIVINSASGVKHTATLIFLHGLGDTGHGWAPVMKQLSKKFDFIKFICPHAPKRSVTLNGGMVMPAWYDIKSLGVGEGGGREEDIAGLTETSDVIKQLVEQEANQGIARNRIFIGGFSQGGASSLFSLLMKNGLDDKIGGVIALSAYIPASRHLQKETPAKTITRPIFMGHGRDDGIINYNWALEGKAYLENTCGAKVTFKTYEGMDHSACAEEIEDVSDFLKSLLLDKPEGCKEEL